MSLKINTSDKEITDKILKSSSLPALITEFTYEGAALTSNGVENLRVECLNGFIKKVTRINTKPNLKRILMPGLVDRDVNYRDFNEADKETIETGSYHSMMTGAMEVLINPKVQVKLESSTGPLDSLDRLIAYKSVCEKAHIPARIRGLLTPQLSKDVIIELSSKCNNHWKAFTSDYNDYKSLEEKVSLLPAGAVIDIQCEDQAVIKLNKGEWNPCDTRTHYKARPPIAEVKAVSEVLRIAKQHPDKEFIINNVSTKEAVKLVIKAKKELSNLKVETCYHYFKFNVNNLTNSMLKCDPPLRTASDVEALFKALLEGGIDYLSSCHEPQTRKDKIRNASGIPGYNSGAVGWLINEGLRRYEGDELKQYLSNLLKASSLNTHPEWAIKEGNPVRLIMLNMKERWVREKDNYTKAHSISPWVGEALPRLELLIYRDQVIYNKL